MYVDIDIDKIKKDFRNNLAQALSVGYPLKYAIAKALSWTLMKYPWVQEIYYSEISLGEFVEGEDIDGRDVDVLIKTSIPSTNISRSIEQQLEDALNTVLQELGLCPSNGHNIVELHIDDIYARCASEAILNGRTPHNAILLYKSGTATFKNLEKETPMWTKP